MYLYELHRGDQIIATGHLNHDQPLEVGERIHVAGHTGIVREIIPGVGHNPVRLIVEPTLNEEIHAPIGGVRDSGWGRTGPDSLADFTDIIWINATSGERELPF